MLNQRNALSKALLHLWSGNTMTPGAISINRHLGFLLILTLAAAAFRLVPHPPNVSPIAALALFGGVYFRRHLVAFLLPLAAMFVSDCLLGFYPAVPFVYASFAVVVLLGSAMHQHRSLPVLALTAVAGSILYFLLSNFGYWLMMGMYPRTPTGLLGCYIAAIPFFQYTLMGDLFFTMSLFGGYQIAVGYQQGLPARRLTRA